MFTLPQYSLSSGDHPTTDGILLTIGVIILHITIITVRLGCMIIWLTLISISVILTTNITIVTALETIIMMLCIVKLAEMITRKIILTVHSAVVIQK